MVSPNHDFLTCNGMNHYTIVSLSTTLVDVVNLSSVSWGISNSLIMVHLHVEIPSTNVAMEITNFKQFQ